MAAAVNSPNRARVLAITSNGIEADAAAVAVAAVAAASGGTSLVGMVSSRSGAPEAPVAISAREARKRPSRRTLGAGQGERAGDRYNQMSRLPVQPKGTADSDERDSGE